ncbi:hypothetical protein [Scytonema sp. PRP1]|uniref:hypothetical protein n=1 Tax=Scytonema sp. PRP1 TaxID=3120513 RepID=UPI002FD00381
MSITRSTYYYMTAEIKLPFGYAFGTPDGVSAAPPLGGTAVACSGKPYQERCFTITNQLSLLRYKSFDF